jgi:hypothetical protein
MSRAQDPREPFQPPSSVTVREREAPWSDKESRSPESISPAGSSPPAKGRDALSTEPRQVHEIRGRTYRLRPSEVAAMVELGKFRAIAQEDLIEFFYAGDKNRFRPDAENLIRQGLIQVKSIPHETTGSRTLLTLTKQGHGFLTKTQAAGNDQILYHGFTKPREAHHDADLYRLYQRACEKIQRQGGKNLRVVLDYEMKKRIYHDLAKLGEDRNSPERQRQVAERHQVEVVRGKIPVPDIRIEYETRDGEKARIDLELATGHYRGRSLAEKIHAGFAIYAHGDEAAKLRKVLHQRELTAEILSL